MKRNIMDYETPHVVVKNARRVGAFDDSGQSESQWSGAYQRRLSRKKRLYGKRVFALALGVFFTVFAVAAALVIYAPFNIRLKKTEFFMLVLSSESTLAGAKEAAEAVQISGGAGFVISDGDFRIAAFVYQKRADADTVLQRLGNEYSEAEVLSFCKNRTKIRRFDSRADEKALKNILDYPSVLAEDILAIVYDLDTFSVTESGAMPVVDALKETVQKYSDAATSLYAEFGTVFAAKLAVDYYAEIADSLNQIGIISFDKKLTVSLKNIACEVVYKSFLLREKLEILY